MIYNIEFQFEIYEILKILDRKESIYYTVLDIFEEFSKSHEVDLHYINTLKKRIRHTLVQLEEIKKVEKIETIDNRRKVLIYKFKILNHE